MARKSRKNLTVMKCEIDKKIYRVGIYVRLSKINDKIKDMDTIQNQKNIILDYIKDKEQFKLVEIYEDINKTGTNFFRDSFERLLEDVRKGKINCIIVKDLSRFGRNYIECGNYLEKIFPFMNVRFIAVNDNYDSVNKDSSEILLLHLKNIVNEVYAKDISNKISTALKEKKKMGYFTGSFASYGYLKDPNDKNKIIINEEIEHIVKQIFNFRVKGYSYNKIAIILNKKGVLSPYAYLYSKGRLKSERFKNTKWNNNNVKNILQNQIYIGHMVQGRKKNEEFGKQRRLDEEDWIVAHNTHKPIISEDIFYKVQEINNMKKNIYLQNNIKKEDELYSKNIFKTFIKCGECGKKLIRRKERNNKFRFICRDYSIKQCSFYGIKEDILKDIIFCAIKNQINLNQTLEKLVKKSIETVNLEIKSINTNIKNINKKIDKIKNFNILNYEDYLKDILSKEQYINKKNINLLELSDLQNKQRNFINKLENISENINRKKDILNFIDMSIFKPELIRELIKEINIYEDKIIEIKFDYKEIF